MTSSVSPVHSIHEYGNGIYKVVTFKGNRDPDNAYLRTSEATQSNDAKLDIWQSNDVYFVVIYYAIPAYYPELELQIVFLSGFNANHLYKAKSRKAWIIHRCLAVSLYLQMCYFREWSLTGQPTNIADDEH